MEGLLSEKTKLVLEKIIQHCFYINRMADRMVSVLSVKFVMPNTSNIIHKNYAHWAPVYADLISDYMDSRDCTTIYGETPRGDQEYESPLDCINKALEMNIELEKLLRKSIETSLEERDYTLSYKMPFMISLIDNLSSIGEAEIDKVLDGYIAFYMDRLDRGLAADRAACPYTYEYLSDRKAVKKNMLTNPFEKFERKRFMYYSKDLGKIALNTALFNSLKSEDFKRIRNQMEEDLKEYYSGIENKGTD